jgi:hypothetical protein
MDNASPTVCYLGWTSGQRLGGGVQNRHPLTATGVGLQRYDFPCIVTAQDSSGQFVIQGVTGLIAAE